MAKNDIEPKNPEEENEELQETIAEGQQILKSVSPLRIAIPIIIGLGFVVYLFAREFDADEFAKINWSSNVLMWIGGAIFFMCARHFFYMVRLRIVTGGFFSWKKCFELIIMWEFSSAVTPTNVGGAAVAMFAISQEKLPGGKTAMIILYTIVIDTFFFLSALLGMFLVFGPIMIQPDSYSFSHLITESQWGIPFLIAYGVMMTYGGLFFYGVLINAKGLQRFLLWVCKFRWLRRFEERARNMTNDMESASQELRKKKWTFHVGTYLSTGAAWFSRFMVLNCLIFAFIAYAEDPAVQAHYNSLMIDDLDYGLLDQQFFIYARQQAMYVIMAILPTPGGAGAAEYAFQTFHNDYLPAAGTLLLIMTIFWRFFTYYIYLFIGAIAVPNWIRKLINRRQLEAAEEKA